jgi:hypothetical protein
MLSSIDELLKPRYKVIADYPGCPYEIGTILYVDDEGELFSPIAGYAPSIIKIMESEASKFNHFLKPLQWWEDRELDQMPRYVKCIATPDQKIMPGDVFKLAWIEPGWGTDHVHTIFLYTNCYIPATESEYNTYTNK